VWCTGLKESVVAARGVEGLDRGGALAGVTEAREVDDGELHPAEPIAGAF